MHSQSFVRLRRWTHLLLAAAFAWGCGSAEQELVPQAAGDVAVSQEVTRAATTEGEDNRPAILFLGTSLTAGYGLDDPDLAFPALVQDRIDRLGLEFRVVNAGVSGDTSAGGLERLRFLLNSPIRVLILELGANDGLRGLDTEALERNLGQVIQQTRERYPDVKILVAGMEAPTNLGSRYTNRFRTVFMEVARQYNAELVPFLLEGVAAVPELNQADRIHPTAEGHRMILETVWSSLGPLLEGL